MQLIYCIYPSEYVQKLKKDSLKGRKKARAFMEYFDDLEHGEYRNGIFYSDSWNVSKTTSYTWIKEFDIEIENFYRKLEQ